VTSREIERAARMAGQLCSAALAAPADDGARTTLSDSLLALEKAVVDDGHDRSAHLRGLMHQAGVWADIVRNRIDANRSAGSVERSLRQLQQVLSALIDGLGHGEKS
jgi:ribosomal protein L4